MPGVRHVLTVASVGVALAAALPAAALPAGALPTGAGARVPRAALQAANFRFCSASQRTCLPERDDNAVTTVRVGTQVSWSYADTACDAVVVCPGHNVVFTDGRGSKRLVKSDGRPILRMTFTRPGRFTYFCTAHQSFGMTGTIVVKRR